MNSKGFLGSFGLVLFLGALCGCLVFPDLTVPVPAPVPDLKPEAEEHGMVIIQGANWFEGGTTNETNILGGEND